GVRSGRLMCPGGTARVVGATLPVKPRRRSSSRVDVRGCCMARPEESQPVVSRSRCLAIGELGRMGFRLTFRGALDHKQSSISTEDGCPNFLCVCTTGLPSRGGASDRNNCGVL